MYLCQPPSAPRASECSAAVQSAQKKSAGALPVPDHDNDAATGALSPRLLALAGLTTHLRRTTCLSAQG